MSSSSSSTPRSPSPSFFSRLKSKFKRSSPPPVSSTAPTSTSPPIPTSFRKKINEKDKGKKGNKQNRNIENVVKNVNFSSTVSYHSHDENDREKDNGKMKVEEGEEGNHIIAMSPPSLSSSSPLALSSHNENNISHIDTSSSVSSLSSLLPFLPFVRHPSAIKLHIGTLSLLPPSPLLLTLSFLCWHDILHYRHINISFFLLTSHSLSSITVSPFSCLEGQCRYYCRMRGEWGKGKERDMEMLERAEREEKEKERKKREDDGEGSGANEELSSFPSVPPPFSSPLSYSAISLTTLSFSLPYLRTLILTSYPLTLPCCHIISSLPSLLHLSVSGCRPPTAVAIGKLLTCLIHDDHSDNENLNDSDHDDRHIYHNNNNSSSRLLSLDVSSTIMYSSTGVTDLLQFPSLVSLQLSRCRISRDFPMLRALHSLLSLNLSHNISVDDDTLRLYIEGGIMPSPIAMVEEMSNGVGRGRKISTIYGKNGKKGDSKSSPSSPAALIPLPLPSFPPPHSPLPLHCLFLDDISLSTEVLLSLLTPSLLPHLHSVTFTLKSFSPYNEKLLSQLAERENGGGKCSPLRLLHINRMMNYIGDIISEDGMKSISHMVHLTQLKLQYVSHHSDTWRTMLSPLKRLEKLAITRPSTSHIGNMGSDHHHHDCNIKLYEEIKMLPSLTQFYIFNGSDVYHYVDILLGSKSIKVMNIDEYGPSPAALTNNTPSSSSSLSYSSSSSSSSPSVFFPSPTLFSSFLPRIRSLHPFIYSLPSFQSHKMEIFSWLFAANFTAKQQLFSSWELFEREKEKEKKGKGEGGEGEKMKKQKPTINVTMVKTNHFAFPSLVQTDGLGIHEGNGIGNENHQNGNGHSGSSSPSLLSSTSTTTNQLANTPSPPSSVPSANSPLGVGLGLGLSSLSTHSAVVSPPPSSSSTSYSSSSPSPSSLSAAHVISVVASSTVNLVLMKTHHESEEKEDKREKKEEEEDDDEEEGPRFHF